ncbi:MAG TPA: hypothetical protein VEH76_07285 [Methylocystis sp.]|nr:hypothetical protein [Methylocystis sp.]
MAMSTPTARPKVKPAPALFRLSHDSRPGRSRTPFRSAPPCITLGQLLRGGILALAALAYADLAVLSDFLPKSPAIQAQTTQDADPTPVAAIEEPEQAGR